MEVAFFFTADQAAEFYIWWRDDLLQGGLWFNCSWPSIRPGGMICQFLTEPVMDHVYMGAHKVSATVQVRGAGKEVGVCVPDPYYYPTPAGHTILLMHGETIVDSSSAPKALLNSGASVSSAAAKFGLKSLAFGGTSEYISHSPVDSAFYFEGLPYTAEAWIHPLAISGKIRHIFGMAENLTGEFAYTYMLAVNSTGSVNAYVQATTGGSGGVAMSSAAGLITPGNWYHLAFCRLGASAKLFLNGSLVASSASWVNYPTAKTQHVAIGAVANGYFDGSVGMWHGYIDDLRVTRGVARYTSDFSPPTRPYCTQP